MNGLGDSDDQHSIDLNDEGGQADLDNFDGAGLARNCSNRQNSSDEED